MRIDATHITGFFVLDGLLTREWDAAWDALQHLVLPAHRAGHASRSRSSCGSPGRRVLDVLDEDYVRTAEAKGLADATVRGRHVLRNALLPVSTTIGLQTGLLLSGAVLTETRLRVRRGRLGARRRDQSARDYPCCRASSCCSRCVYVLVNLLVDLSYGVIDPRVRVR